MNGEPLNRLRSEPEALLRAPAATYRIQLGSNLTFDDAAQLVPYLDALGVSDCYTSPFFETASHSSHGYDVSDHNRFREELGGEAAFGRFADALKRHGLGLLVDLVPNHMGIAQAHNAWWRDVLENGASAEYASFFDIDWQPVKRELANKVLLPILGDQYGIVLESGQLQLELDRGTFCVTYFDATLPVAARSYGRILGHRLEELQATLGPEHRALVELKSVLAWFATIPGHSEADRGKLVTRRRQKEYGRERLEKLLDQSPEIAASVHENVRIFNGTPGDPGSFDLLDALLTDQAYRVAYWRVAGEEINYRRFFDINELAAIRMEQPQVFEEAHRLVFRLVREGAVTGFRIDHPDGLYAPAEYFRRLQSSCVAEAAAHAPFYIVAEKILAPGERLPDTWAVAGTTGYEFLNLLNGIFVDRSQARALDQLYTRLLRDRVSFTDIVYESKRLLMETSMASELHMLAHRLNIISEKHRSSRDFTLGSLTTALREIIAAFPVYRTYFGESGGEAAERDREAVERAVELARRRTPALSSSIYDWLLGVLTLQSPPWADETTIRDRLDFVMRFQQITGPVTAKGYEDTALYRYNRLVSLNEVGGDPSRFGTSIAEFHAANTARQQHCPAALSATSTHDTKRSEDVRARINVLSEIPREWRERMSRWQRLNRRHRTMVDGRAVPGPNEEYFIYQTLVGAWPISIDRLRQYLLKAAHETKEWTSWINPDSRYDDALIRFAEAILDARQSREFLRDFTDFQDRIAGFGLLNSLAQTLIKITAPGVPDFYQGTELWNFSLVDPDNRRPVDFELRRRLLDELVHELEAEDEPAALARRLVDSRSDGRIKMFVIRQGLMFRRQHVGLYRRGAYQPLDTSGAAAEHVCAFARVTAEAAAVTVTPRLLMRRGGTELPLGVAYWQDTELSLPNDLAGQFRDVFTGRVVQTDTGDHGCRIGVGDILVDFPVALLERTR
jgi:(1->4)-alpha-D-glucan 1-alpha-D-glucosylmutase